MTDHRQLMEELRHAQRMDVIGQLSSSVAHDFNNLLTLIAGYAELLSLEAGRRRADRASWRRDIQTTTTRASTLDGEAPDHGAHQAARTGRLLAGRARSGELSEVLDRILGTDVRSC